MAGVGKILIIDDDPTQRLIAYRDLAALRKRVILPETVGSLLTIPVEDIGLLILDRWLGESWHAAADACIERVPESVTVWEWTCDEWGQPLCKRVVRTIHKRPGELLTAINEWIGSK